MDSHCKCGVTHVCHYGLLHLLPLPHALYHAGVLAEQTLPTAPADHLAGEGWGPRQNYL